MAPVTADGNNHLSVFSYDASGNTTNDGTFTYPWDAESQLKSSGGITYAYDGDGRRVSKTNGSIWRLYWYGSGGEVLAETDGAGITQNEYIFFGGQRIADLPAGGNPLYYVEDLLGSTRVLTTNTGVVCHDGDFSPYGAEGAWTATCGQNYRFEGKERDDETGNDNFGARYYTYRFGRWLSADWSSVPVPVPYANLTNPQTLNLYSMVADDPESFADLDGHDAQQANSAQGSRCEVEGPAFCSQQQREDLRAAQDAAKDEKPKPTQQNQKTEEKAEVGYGETAGLVPAKADNAPKNASPYDTSTYDPKSTQQLQDARTNIMDISERNNKVKSGTPSDPNNPIQQKAFNDNMAAAKNSDGSKPGKFFFIRQQGKGNQHPPKSARYGQGKPLLSYGPFRNVGGGDVPRGSKTYIDIYDK
jgi:RHS repeat-associated protein